MTDIETTLAERGERYGVFATHARIAQRLKTVMWDSPGWERLEADQREALEMIQHKIARILNGDPCWADSWRDVAGYSRLVEMRLEGDI
jgi:hypothetical protein